MDTENKAAILARAGIVSVGLAAIVCGINLLSESLGIIGNTINRQFGHELGLDSIIVLCSSLIGPAFMLIFGIALLKKTESISQKYFSISSISTEILIYRMLFCILGLYHISRGFIDFLTLSTNLSVYYFTPSNIDIQMSPSSYVPWLVGAVANFSLGIFLFRGAPGLFGWYLGRCHSVDKSVIKT
ncbi:hypothetical protein [Desulfoluna butyratoxydans]|uniref:Uncharacterized protein n=1 Tax=Desulfoluna butyratoxydans TaxID=231438 RepID=A0A4U8YMX0_9BACT|nr:hypothetical protein [Desulfoluna butyratoxydans]VFQ45396.1 hypothetical protein MSL71_30530 [Desulfoluna butyratoxydans]